MATNPKAKNGFFIGVGCPGCGGTLSLDADFFVTRCEHCNSVLRIVMPDTPPAYLMPCNVADREIRNHVDRHLKQNGLPLTRGELQVKKLFYPYWRIQASVLKLRNKTEVKKLYSDSESQTESVIETDRSTVSTAPYLLTVAAGAHLDGIPDTLGLRTETVRVTPFADENVPSEFDVLPLTRSWEAVENRVRMAVAAMSQINTPDFGTNLTRLFNPSWSLVYFPYLVVEAYSGGYRRFVLDGLVGRVVKAITPQEPEPLRSPDTRDHARVKLGGVKVAFETDLAPQRLRENFVEDALSRGVVEDLMAAETDADHPDTRSPEVSFGKLDVVFHRCDVCGADLPSEMSHVYICSNCHELQVVSAMTCRLPQVDVVLAGEAPVTHLVPFWRLGLPETTTRALGNLLGGLDRCEQLLIPALGSNNYEALHKLAKRMTAAQAKMPTEPADSLDERFLPVRTGLSEALALTEIIICRERLDRGLGLPDSLDLQPTRIGLVYVPFHLENYFYLDSVLNAVSVEKALVR